MTVDSEVKKLIRSEVVAHLKALREADGKLWISIENVHDYLRLIERKVDSVDASLSALSTALVGAGSSLSSAAGGTDTSNPDALKRLAGSTLGRWEAPTSSASETSKPAGP